MNSDDTREQDKPVRKKFERNRNRNQSVSKKSPEEEFQETSMEVLFTRDVKVGIKLARFYEYGYGCQVDERKAFEWYKKAADLGDAEAMGELSRCYDFGIGCSKSESSADYWMKKKIKTDRINNGIVDDDGCFITTAVCGSFGKADDCYELTMFRSFRDNWLKFQPEGNALIRSYYEIAPAIVKKINAMPNPKDIYREIWEKYLKECLSCIESKDNESCRSRYMTMVRDLQRKYLH